MSKRPNIVAIMADDLGYGDMGVFNGGATRTPALDRLAEEGVCLSQHYAGSAVCAPSRAAFLTGRYPHRTGAIDTLEGRGLDRLALRETTMGDLFGHAGYATGLMGKWHSGALDPRYHPNRRGFQEFVGFCGGWQDYYQWRLDVNGARREPDGRYLTDVITDESVAFVERHAAEPFLLYVSYNAPHFPFQAPEEDVAPYREAGQYTEAVSLLYGMVQRMDAGIGRILEALDRLGLAEDTILLFTSDNGPQFGGEGEMCTTRFNCGYHGAKGSVYEGGIRVPLMVRWPAGLDGGRDYAEMVHFADWLPTLLSAAGIEPPRWLALDGVDMLAALRGQGDPVDLPRFWQWNRYTPEVTCNAAVRDGAWKLVRPAIREAMGVSQEDLEMDNQLKYEPWLFDDIRRDPEPPRVMPGAPPAELYNIAQDPLELHNLAGAEPERAARMLSALEGWFAEVEAERRTIGDA